MVQGGKLIWVIFFALFMGFCVQANAAGKIETVEVTGMGATPEKAIKNATKEAVRQVVGMYVVAEAATKNRKLIKDEVLSASNGFVRKFTTIEKEVDEDGIHTVTARVEVEVGKLAEALTGLNIAMKKVDSDNLTAQIVAKAESAQDFEALAHRVIFEPIEKNKGLYNIKLNFNTDLVNDDNFEDIKTFYRAKSWMQGLHIKEQGLRRLKKSMKYELGDLVPIQITMKVGIKDAYLDSVAQFLDKNSKTKKEGGNIKITSNNTRPDENRLDNVVIRDHEKAVLKTWKLGKRNARIMGKLNQRFLGGFHTYFKLTLLGEGERRLGEQTYLKQVCSRGNTVLGPKPPRWNPGRAPRNLSRSMTVSIFKTVPSGNIITTYMRPLEREERLSYDFNKSPKISSSIFTCKIGYSNPGMSTYVDFARLAIGTYFRDPKSEPYNEGGGVISFFERGTYNNAVWFGYLFLEPNIAKQLKSGKMEVITVELN